MKKLVWVGRNTEECTPGRVYKIIDETDEESVKFINNHKYKDTANRCLFITKKEAKQLYPKTDFFIKGAR